MKRALRRDAWVRIEVLVQTTRAVRAVILALLPVPPALEGE